MEEIKYRVVISVAEEGFVDVIAKNEKLAVEKALSEEKNGNITWTKRDIVGYEVV